MSYQHHWVVVYDEDWGAFMVDIETTMAKLSEEQGVVYNKDSGRWEFMEEGSELQLEYLRLEDILAYNLTRLDLTAGIGQDTHMTKMVQVSISYNMLTDEFMHDGPMTDEEMIEYAKECFYDDIHSFVAENDLMDYIHGEIIND